jgi:hypothetical protein
MVRKRRKHGVYIMRELNVNEMKIIGGGCAEHCWGDLTVKDIVGGAIGGAIGGSRGGLAGAAWGAIGGIITAIVSSLP